MGLRFRQLGGRIQTRTADSWWVCSIISASIALGLIQSYFFRYSLNPDGLSYIDIADNIKEGNLWKAINAYWSPLYPGLLAVAFAVLRPLPAYEFQVVHLTNFLVYLLAAITFRYFLLQLYQETRRGAENVDTVASRPLWYIFGFSVFTYASIRLISTCLVTPDLLLAALVYWASGVAVEIRRLAVVSRTAPLGKGVLLGTLLGLAYWTKAAAFLFAPVFIACAFIGLGNDAKRLYGFGLCLVAYAVVCAALLVPLSISKGRLTLGDSGALNYLWNVNKAGGGTNSHWFETDRKEIRNGRPVHPTRRLDTELPVFEFATPVDGTYPVWKDPSYWNEGLMPYFDVGQQVRILLTNASVSLDFCQPILALLAGLCVIASAPDLRGEFLRNLARLWFLIVPSICPFLTYWLVHIEDRFVGSFLVIISLSLFAGLRETASLRATGFLRSFVLVASILLVGTQCLYPVLRTKALMIMKGQDRHMHLELADQLHRRGLHRGDSIACIGTADNNYWARLAGLRIVAEIPEGLSDRFWNADPKSLRRVLGELRGIGVKYLVSEISPGTVPRSPLGQWTRIGNPGIYLLELDDFPGVDGGAVSRERWKR